MAKPTFIEKEKSIQKDFMKMGNGSIVRTLKTNEIDRERAFAAVILGHNAHPGAAPHLVDAMKTEKDGQVRTHIIAALGEIAGKLPKTHPLNKTLKHVDPYEHSKVFTTLYQQLMKGKLNDLKTSEMKAYVEKLKLKAAQKN